MPKTEEEEKEKIKKALEALQKAQAVLEEIFAKENEELGWWDRRCSVLVEVHKRGGIVTRSEWIEIGAKYGYDPRGLGGFFTGSEPSMTSIAGQRKALTDRGRRDAEDYLGEHPEIK
jgi:hypothetical protein